MIPIQSATRTSVSTNIITTLRLDKVFEALYAFLRSTFELIADCWTGRTRTPVDLSMRNAGAQSWERARQRRELTRSPHCVSEPLSWGLGGPRWAMQARSSTKFERNSDFTDLVEIDSNTIAFFLGEVPGGGLPAALYQTSCSSLLRYGSCSADAAKTLEEVNSILSQREQDGRFATLTYGVLDLTSGKLQLVSAGHRNPVIVRGCGSAEMLNLPKGLPLGLSRTTRYRTTQTRLLPGDRVVLCSSGITESKDDNRETFGGERLTDELSSWGDAELSDSADSLLERLADYSPRGYLDRTVLAVHYEDLVQGDEACAENASYGCP